MTPPYTAPGAHRVVVHRPDGRTDVFVSPSADDAERFANAYRARHLQVDVEPVWGEPVAEGLRSVA